MLGIDAAAPLAYVGRAAGDGVPGAPRAGRLLRTDLRGLRGARLLQPVLTTPDAE